MRQQSAPCTALSVKEYKNEAKLMGFTPKYITWEQFIAV